MLMPGEIKAAVEAILFLNCGAMNREEISQMLGIPPASLTSIMQEMIKEYENNSRGIKIVEREDAYIMCTKEEYAPLLAKMQKPSRKGLSPAIIETLAIIAYQQPVTRAEIEQIRGVKSDRIVNSLIEKGLIQEAGQKAVPGRPSLFVTTEEFLKLFGLFSLAELPVVKDEQLVKEQSLGK